MTIKNKRSDVAPEQVLEQLRQLMSSLEPARPAPPPFEPITEEPEPWSVPPPGGFEALRSQLRRAS